MNPETALRNRIYKRLIKIPESDWEITPPGSLPGKHDITGCVRGRYVSFEVKTETGRPSKLQVEKYRRLKRAGAVVAFVRSIEQAENELKGAGLL